MPRKPKKDVSESQRAKPKQGAGAKETSSQEGQVQAAAQADTEHPIAGVEVTQAVNSQRSDPYYRTIFMSVFSGFELGEDRRFKQRVFRFREKPDDHVLNALRENGFTYRPAEKFWTIQADYASRTTSDRLARQFADGTSRDR